VRRALALGLAVAAVLAGCGSESGLQPGPGADAPGDSRGGPAPGQSADERLVRAWNQAVNLGDYESAADLFERGAVVEQLGESRLATRADAVAFNRSLPCRADVIDVEADGRSTLAAFRLREGRTGECDAGGRARVRFVIRDGRIQEWRQLPAPQAPSGEVARDPRRVL